LVGIIPYPEMSNYYDTFKGLKEGFKDFCFYNKIIKEEKVE